VYVPLGGGSGGPGFASSPPSAFGALLAPRLLLGLQHVADRELAAPVGLAVALLDQHVAAAVPPPNEPCRHQIGCGDGPNANASFSEPGGRKLVSLRRSVYDTLAPTIGAPCRYFAWTSAASVSP
jgi:hypothetical protein